jgi:hypothetical protein
MLPGPDAIAQDNTENERRQDGRGNQDGSQLVEARQDVPKREGSRGPQAKYAPSDNALSPTDQPQFSNIHDDAPDVCLQLVLGPRIRLEVTVS